MKLTDKLDMLMKERGIKDKAELSKLSGIPYTTIINFYEKGTDNIKLSTLKKLAGFFGVPLDYIADDNFEENISQVIQYGEMVNLPIVGRISCGNGSIAYEEIEGFELTPKEWVGGGDYFYLRAKGDSMTGARIYDGDLLLIRKQEDVENGEIAAVWVNDEIYLKRVFKTTDAVILHSENPMYPPAICTKENRARIIGKLRKAIIRY